MEGAVEQGWVEQVLEVEEQAQKNHCSNEVKTNFCNFSKMKIKKMKLKKLTYTQCTFHLFHKCLEGAVEQGWVEQVLEVEEQAHVGHKQPLK